MDNEGPRRSGGDISSVQGSFARHPRKPVTSNGSADPEQALVDVGRPGVLPEPEAQQFLSHCRTRRRNGHRTGTETDPSRRAKFRFGDRSCCETHEPCEAEPNELPKDCPSAIESLLASYVSETEMLRGLNQIGDTRSPRSGLGRALEVTPFSCACTLSGSEPFPLMFPQSNGLAIRVNEHVQVPAARELHLASLQGPSSQSILIVQVSR